MNLREMSDKDFGKLWLDVAYEAQRRIDAAGDKRPAFMPLIIQTSKELHA